MTKIVDEYYHLYINCENKGTFFSIKYCKRFIQQVQKENGDLKGLNYQIFKCEVIEQGII